MVTRDRFRRTRRVAAVVVMLATLGIALWHPGSRSAFWQGIEGQFLDARFLWRGPIAPPEGVAIVAFDDAAVSRIGTFPPPRKTLAAAVSDAARAGAKVIALDFLLIEPREDDQALAGALTGVDAVLGVAEASSDAPLLELDGEGFSVVVATDHRNPLPALGPTEALRGTTSLGHVILRHDADGAVRRIDAAHPLATQDGIVWYPALAMAALTDAGNDLDLQLWLSATGGKLTVGESTIPLDMLGAIPLKFYGPGGTIQTFSVTEVQDADLEGKIVFLGATATGFGDRHATSFDAAFPGAELHATLAANMLEKRLLRRDAVAWFWDIALALVASTLGFIVAGVNRPWLALSGTAAVTVALAAVLQAAFIAGWWLDVTTVLLSLLLGVGFGAGLRLLDHRRRAANLALYHSPLLVERLASAADPQFETAARPAVVLFVDVENFTGYSEQLGPEGTAQFLRVFHGLVEQTVEPLGGVIAHFAGDGAMVVFGLPKPRPDDATQALRFIEDLYESVGRAADWPGLGLRVGGHAGPVQTGVVGGRHHRQLTVSGDVVNTASRLQDFAKSYGAAIALSEALVQSEPEALARAGKLGLSPSGRHKLRGRQEPILVWTDQPTKS